MRFLLLFFLSVFYLLRVVKHLLPILNGFLAKHLCSAIFVSQRNIAEIRQHELRVKLFRLPGFRIDSRRQSVRVSLWGIGMREAFYHAERGCSLCQEPPSGTTRFNPVQHRKRPTSALSNSSDKLSPTLQSSLASWMETRPAQTLAVYALYRGKTVAEMYAPGIGRDTPLPGWSMAKSVMNALVGILVRQGRLSLHAPLPEHIWQGTRDGRIAITMHHLLQMSSGLPWSERYWWSSDVTRMLFTSDDASHGITAKPYRIPPGTRWEYASGTTNVIGKALRYLLGEEYLHFPYLNLFAPLGMQTALLETDTCGNFVGSSYMLASARDWARFGQLYLQDGLWEGQRILLKEWVDYTTTPAAPAPQQEYGAHFWLNRGILGQPASRKMPDVPAEVFYASGFGGQRVFIIPSRELVIVRLGAAHFKEPDFNALMPQLLTDLSLKV